MYALGALAGDAVQALTLSLPAETATNTPAALRLLTAVLADASIPPPSDMFATAGLMWFALTQSTPSMKSAQEPFFVQSPPSTLTARM